jgi:hypothetical protein
MRSWLDHEYAHGRRESRKAGKTGEDKTKKLDKNSPVATTPGAVSVSQSHKVTVKASRATAKEAEH